MRSQTRRRKGQILIIDHEQDIAYTVKEFFENEGYLVKHQKYMNQLSAFAGYYFDAIIVNADSAIDYLIVHATLSFRNFYAYGRDKVSNYEFIRLLADVQMMGRDYTSLLDIAKTLE